MLRKHRTLITIALFCASTCFFIGLTWSANKRRTQLQNRFTDQRLGVFESWTYARFVEIQNPLVLEHGIFEIPIKGRNLLTDNQHQLLRETIRGGLRAFSYGGESNYLEFRFPPGVAWSWKTNASRTLSNYFKIGYVWSGGAEVLETQWMKKYGHPDRLMDFIPWEGYLKKDFNTPELVEKLKAMHIDRYGPGVDFTPPKDQWQQWKLMCKDISGDTWYSNLWKYLYPLKSAIIVSNYMTHPPFYDKLMFEDQFSGQAEGVDSGFSNLGIASLGSKSLIEWQESIDDIIARNGFASIADVLLTVKHPEPFLPTRFIMRLVYRNDHHAWVPYDLVDCSIPSQPTDRDVWW